MAGAAATHVEHWIFLLVFLLFNLDELRAVQITALSVPAWIENGTIDHVILDCDFTHSKDEQGIVVKWFLNDDPEPIYQWIPEHNSRTTSFKFQRRLDLEFRINNKLTMHRALKILRPTTELSGKYRCDVLSLENQDFAESTMVIYAPPKKLDFVAQETSNRGLNLSCEAVNVFPQPQLRINKVYPGEPKQDHLPSRKVVRENAQQGTFDVTVSTEIDSTSLPEDGAAFFECEIHLGTQYTTRSRLQYFTSFQSVVAKDNVTPTKFCAKFKIRRTGSSPSGFERMAATVLYSSSDDEETTEPTNGIGEIGGSNLQHTTLFLAILAVMLS